MNFDHVNIRTTDLEAMRRFLEEVAGLEAGERPNFAFPGYWMYADGRAVAHLIEWRGEGDLHAGPIDHIAFGPFDYEAKRVELEKAGRAYRTADVPGRPLRQIFVEGPDGVTLELQCPTG